LTTLLNQVLVQLENELSLSKAIEYHESITSAPKTIMFLVHLRVFDYKKALLPLTT
jgi:hypothetical protein